MHEPLVSVIVPVYNKELHLRKTINSVLEQEYQNLELIIVDDGSTDNSKKVIEEFAENDLRCRYFYQENSGVSSARNHGIRASLGSYIAFLDADDIYDKFFLSRMVALSKGVDFVYCGYYIKHSGIKRPRRQKIKFMEEDFALNYLLCKTTPNTNSWLINKDFIDDNSIWFDESVSWGEDMLFFATVALLANSYRPCKGFHTQYNMYNDGSITKSYSPERKIELDFIWMDKLENIIYSSKNRVLASTYVSALNGYRRPASIIYNVFLTLHNSGKASARDIIHGYRENLREILFNNGLRSLKLYMYYIYLRFRLL